MQILIANDIDDTLFQRNDTRGWSHRVFWFAEPGDIVVVPTQPDPAFVSHVAHVRSADLSAIKILIAPPGRYGDKMIDMRKICSPSFAAQINNALPKASVDIFFLFPTSFAEQFCSIVNRVRINEEYKFFRQGGSNLANSKAFFRALASSDVALADGEVCFSPKEASEAIRRIGEPNGCVLIKRAQGGAGNGNELLVIDTDLPTNVGVRSCYTLKNWSEASISEYLRARWDWASMGNRYPVVVEAFQNVLSSVCIEYLIESTCVSLMGPSTLCFEDNRIASEIFGYTPLDQTGQATLEAGGLLLAERLLALGYRGHACFDAVLSSEGKVLFTEINARTATGTHVNEIFRLGPNRPRLRQFNSHPWWKVSVSEFLDLLRSNGLLFDPATQRGVVMTTPSIDDRLDGGFLYLVCSSNPSEELAINQRLFQRMAEIR